LQAFRENAFGTEEKGMISGIDMEAEEKLLENMLKNENLEKEKLAPRLTSLKKIRCSKPPRLTSLKNFIFT
jgi:hypothetical protein